MFIQKYSIHMMGDRQREVIYIYTDEIIQLNDTYLYICKYK